MEVTCEHCQAKLNIPDEKIPKDQAIIISCPRCKSKISLSTQKSADKMPSPAESESRPAREPEKKSYGYGDYSDDEKLGFYEEGTILALIMADNRDHSEKIKSTVEELGYRYVLSPNTRDAIGKMRFHNFDLIILTDGFDGQPLEHSPILNYLNHISMSVRRRIFVALLGEKFKTMDNMMAFAMSVNVIISTKDMDKLSAIMKKAISDNEGFYKVFIDTLKEMGKA